ncbi:hypothetical protein LTR95_006758 [Oleoguttula sp. CCFEE 5521]
MIRPATEADLLPASQVCARAFDSDNLFGELIHKYRRQYPEDVHIYFLRRFLSKFPKPDNTFLVSTDENDVIVGLAHWCRFRAGEGDDEQPIGDHGLPPNRAADPENEDIIERSMKYAEHFWSDKRAESWYLSCLAVDPSTQGKGVGKPLVAWGFEQAAKEGVCVSVISAKGKQPFYVKCGFGPEKVGNACDGEGNPLLGIEGGDIFFHDI